MARKPRVQYQGAFYHVIVRGNQRQKVFLEEGDFDHYRRLLISYRKRYSFTLYAYVLMPNHVHLLMEQGGNDLSKIMQGLQQSYTQYFNRQYGKTGHLFQGRYKAILCDRDAYLLELIRYIHLNPVRAGMVKRADEYLWSSHRTYLEGRSSAWLEVEMPLGCLDRSRKKAVSAYQEFVREAQRTGHREDLYEVKEQCYLGDDDFVGKIENRQDRETAVLPPLDLGMDQIVRDVSVSFGVSVSRITDHSRNRKGALCRAASAYIATEVGGIPLREAARYLSRDPASLSDGVRKLRERIEDDQDLAARIKKVVKQLGKGKRVKYQITKA